ncbi:MAG: phytoene desaturase [Armatimonadetes bacterium]|nr:phytoene desaturase [Armatimonadota bacterium]
MGKRVAVIGAGLGGLATAARLAYRGHHVTVFEQTDQVGGRNRREQVGDCRFDGGPTLLMMLDPFRKLYADLGERLEDHLELTLCDPSYRVFFRNAPPFDGTPNVARMVAQIESQMNRQDAEKYPGFLGELAELYRAAIPNFVRNNYRSPFDVIHPAQVARVLRHGMLGNLAKRVEQTFQDPRLHQLFTFQSMYLGLSPYDAPAVYGSLTYMEYGEGIWYPRGGLPMVSESVARLAQQAGAEIRLRTPVASIESDGLTLDNGERFLADIVVSNADLPTTQKKLEKAAAPKPLRNSCSAFCLYIDYAGALPELLHHNVVFGADYRGNFESLFTRLELPDDPAFYCSVSCKTDPQCAPEGSSNLFILIPAPNLDHDWSDDDAETLKQKAFARLAEISSFDPGLVRQVKERTPRDWHSELALDQGAAFGISHDLFQSAFFRPRNRSRSQKNLYYVGASTAPGNGLPMVLISAELLEQRLVLDGQIAPGVEPNPAMGATP